MVLTVILWDTGAGLMPNTQDWSGGFKSCLISRILSYGLLVRLSFNKEFIKGIIL